jgi:hypothetical protein
MSRKMVLKAATVAVALGAMGSVAWAEPIKLTDGNMDQVTAGGYWYKIVTPPGEWIPYGQSFMFLPVGSQFWVDPNKVPAAPGDTGSGAAGQAPVILHRHRS